ncbi:hypothetical protein NFI96_029911 [Prochilodus magdalenae]|nr:hypothetical protein NFI96_029911 [Prochilodus magdalenae]
MLRMVRVNLQTSTKDLQHDLAADGVTVHRSTIRRTLHKEMLYGRVMQRKPFLHPHHKQSRLSDTVERGTNVTLRCEAKVSHSSSHPIHSFTFILYENVIYSKNSSMSVVERSLAPAMSSNSGDYKCGVRVGNKDKRSEIRKLTVTGLQTPHLKVQSGVVYEGDEIMATCSATEETGSMLFTFFSNGEEIKTIFRTNSVNATIPLKKIGENNLHCNYRHVLHPNGILSNNSNTVKVIVQNLNITPSIRIWPSANVVEGDRVHINCSVPGYHQSDLEIFLIKNSLLWSDHKPFMHSLEARVENSGEYVCKAEKGNVQKTSTDNLVVSELFSVPVLSITSEQIFEGDVFFLSCRTSTIYQKRITHANVTYTIYKNQHILKAGHIFNTTASQAMNGNFTCVAEAKSIKKTSKQLTINVKVPVSIPVIGTVGQVIVKKPFQILCESMLGTLPITYTLLKSQRPMSQMNTTGSLRRALFNIPYIDHKDEIHSFTCQAENQGPGYSESSQDLNAAVIEPVSKPVLTLSPKDHTITEGMEVNLYCSVKEGTVPVTFTWYRRGSTQHVHATRSYRSEGKYNIDRITREHRGSYYCEAFNDAGVTSSSRDVHLSVNLADWKKAVIAVICILILVLIVTILVLFLKKTGAPRKRKKAVELSVKSARPKSNDPMRMSLTLDFEENAAVNTSPGVMGKSVWSEHVSDSESDDSSREEESEKLQYTENHPQCTVDSEEAPTQDTSVVNGKVLDCKQGKQEFLYSLVAKFGLCGLESKSPPRNLKLALLDVERDSCIAIGCTAKIGMLTPVKCILGIRCPLCFLMGPVAV